LKNYNMKINDESIKNVLNMMSDGIGKENVELYKKLIEQNGIKKIDDVDDFYIMMIYPYEKFLKGLIQVEISKNDEVKFLLLQYNFVEYQFQKIIVDVEGSACSADKSRTIMRRIFDWLNKGEKIEFNYEGEYTYHLPKTVFTTHEEITEFYDGVKNLYYGHYQKYLIELKKVMSKLENKKNENNKSESK